VAGITQGLMWRAQNEGGGLMYPNFVETLLAIKPMYWMRLVGGLMYLAGFFVMAYNLWRTAKSGTLEDEEVSVTELVTPSVQAPWQELAFGKPVVLSVILAALLALFPVTEPIGNFMLMALVIGIGLMGTILIHVSGRGRPGWHALLEGRAAWFSGFTVLAVLVGGVAELVPSIISGNRALLGTKNVPYTALELEGRDVYLKEGCYNCHSQMIRPFTWETARYGEVSSADDSIFDHPFQWGSKRTGPDLSRLGSKYNHQWHYHHMKDPREISPGSNMPPYAHLAANEVEFSRTADKMRALRAAGVPYKPEQLALAESAAHKQAEEIARELTQGGERGVVANSELIALISYLQRLGHIPEPSTPSGKPVQVSMQGGGL
jgi:cytochrome c oxidase cbb3-type subunit I/II